MQQRFPYLILKSLLLLSMAWAIGGCLPDIQENPAAEQWVPRQTAALLKIHDAERFRSDFRNNMLVQSYREARENYRIMDLLEEVLDLEIENGTLLAMLPADSTRTQAQSWLLIMPNGEKYVPADSSGLYLRKESGFVRLSPKEDLVNGSRTDSGEHPELQNSLKTANPRAAATLLLPASGDHPLEDLLLTPISELPVQPTDPGVQIETRWSAFDLDLRSDALLVQGVQIRPDSLWDQRKLLRGIPVLPLQETLRLFPDNARAIYTYSLQQPKVFLSNQQQWSARGNSYASLVESTETLSLLEIGPNSLVALGSLNPEIVLETFRPYSNVLEDFQGTQLYSLAENEILAKAFEPLLNTVPALPFMAQLDLYFVFAEDLETLRDLISAYSLKSTFAYSERFDQLEGFITSESSALAIALEPGASRYLTDSTNILSLPAALQEPLPETYLYAAQLNSSLGSDLLEYQFRKKANPSGSGTGTRMVFNHRLEGNVQAGPYFLKNHLTGRLDIAVQDDQNQLYLFSDTGALFWKKYVSGPIQGRIEQVDLFKNGRWQMAFTTPNGLWILDRNGKTVSPFPREFPGGNLGPLAVFDYENTRNYRLVFSQGSKVHMYDGQGKVVSGFKYTDAGSAILGAPQHFRVGSRDYLVFQLEDGRLEIRNRVGDTRVGVKDRFEFSGNGVYYYRDAFAFTEKNGNLVTVTPGGKIGRNPYSLAPDHGMYATAKTLALVNENQLRVKGTTAELDLGVYAGPVIFYLYDIVYVALTDIQSQRLYLFRSDASGVSGFPVEANGIPDMADTDGDRNPELVVRYRDSAFALYRLKR